MSILIVGADKINAITPKLEEMGISRITHWNARKRATARFKIPRHIDAVIFFTDFLHHTVAKKIKSETKKKGLPCLFCRRSASNLLKKIEVLCQ